nr:hypothetical protein [uncultured Acetatifactor sp.]
MQGFASGGDDYIVKPFSLAELEARGRPICGGRSATADRLP